MTEPGRSLDLDTVRAFVLVADLGSFTRTAEVLDTSQAAISLKLKRLEERLGCRLVERTPRHVRLSAPGERFLPAARELLEAHERALSNIAAVAPRRLALGISDHVLAAELPVLLGRLGAYDPSLVVDVRIAPSRQVGAFYAGRELDAAILRRSEAQGEGELLCSERFSWFASPAFRHRPGTPLKIATLSPGCGIRALSVEALERAGIAWQEAFVGGGVMALGAAVSAGLAVAALSRRVAPAGAVDVGDAFGLPPLPPQDIVLLARPTDHRAKDLLKVIAAAFRGAAAR